MVYDSGDFGAVFEKALVAADWTGFERMRLWATRTDITPQANEPRSNLPRANQGPHA
jgi:hypothetical protein